MYQISAYTLNHIKIVLDVLHKYDPIGVATVGNESEYEPEAIDIGNKCSVVTTEYLALYIRDCFNFWFNEKLNLELCEKMAKEIKEKI